MQPIDRPGAASFDLVDENTQGSVLMQKEIEYASQFYTTQKRLTSIAITQNIHNQKDSNLCTSIAVTWRRYDLHRREIAKNTVIQDQDNIEGLFSFDKCLTLFTGCVSPRSLDGIIVNSADSEALKERQYKSFGIAMERLAHRTMIDIEGWKRILPITDLFRKYYHQTGNQFLEPDRIELTIKEANHTLTPLPFTYEDALKSGHVVVVLVYSNCKSNPNNRTNHDAHSVVLFDHDKDYYYLKNSVHEATPDGDKKLKIAKDRITHETYCLEKRKRALFLRNNPNFGNDNYILSDFGLMLQFKHK